MNIDEAIKFLQQADPTMARLIKKFDPPTLKPNQNYFKSLVRSIIYQQLSSASASAIYNRFKNLFEEDFFLNTDNIA